MLPTPESLRDTHLERGNVHEDAAFLQRGKGLRGVDTHNAFSNAKARGCHVIVLWRRGKEKKGKSKTGCGYLR